MGWVNMSGSKKRTIESYTKEQITELPDDLKKQLLTGSNELWSKILDVIKLDPMPCDINFILIKFYKLHGKQLKRESVQRAIKLLKARGLINIVERGMYTRK